MADLKIRNLQKGFDGQAIIKGIDLDVRDREFVVSSAPPAAASRPCCA